MKSISILPKHIADKIAAGEVVDRPVSVVKELLENAIDAGANSITVEIKNGGKTYIRVTDNGCGIKKEQVETAFLRHATSKISDIDDLFAISTLGFRGEALCSIAAVSKTELITKTSDEKSGVCLMIEGGEIVRKTDIGCPDGTTIVVSDLFYNTPARLKFMKSDSSESALIIDFVSKIALAFSYIKIRLINNGNILFSTTGTGNIIQNILTIFGKDIGEGLIHYYAGNETGRADLEIFVSSQGNTRGNRKYQIYFVNGRYIHSKVLDEAVNAAYKQRIPDGRFPIVFLFYHPNPKTLDVNIHPNKKEVRFADEKAVYEFVTQSIVQALDTKKAMPSFDISQVVMPDSAKLAKKDMQAHTGKEGADHIHQNGADHIHQNGADHIHQNGADHIHKDNVDCIREDSAAYGTSSQNDIASFFAQKRRQETLKAKGLQESEQLHKSQQLNKTQHKAFYEPEKNQTQTEWDVRDEAHKHLHIHGDILNIKATGTVFNTYITGYDKEYFYLIDQHAAHERIFYEHLTENFEAEEKKQQMIMEPILLEVPVSVNEKFKKAIQYLSQLGFEIEQFGEKSYKSSCIPSHMSISEAYDFIMDFIDHVNENTDITDQKKMDKIITNACKKAVKAHDILDMSEIKRLLDDLSKAKNPYSCPHGRPVFLKLSQHEIERMFKRI